LSSTFLINLTSHKDAPKIDKVNQQVRGELAGQASREGTDSIGIGGKISKFSSESSLAFFLHPHPQSLLSPDAPKISVINEQVRGELAGQKSNLDADSMSINNALCK
jgi:hypothetical protein